MTYVSGDTKLRERFVQYETELSAANRKIADCTIPFFKGSHILVTALTQSSNVADAGELQKRMDQLLSQLSQLEEDKRNLAKEKDELHKQLLQQKDRVLQVERDAASVPNIHPAYDSGLKSSLAAIEGEAGGQAKGESLQLQKSLREISSESKLKDAEIQKLKDVGALF